VKLLLDSHAFLWLALDDPKLTQKARELLTSSESNLFLSSATIWELAIKESSGKLKLGAPLERLVEDGVMEFGISYLPVTPRHAHYVSHLPRHHADPFDRMLIAQCHVEAMRLVSGDSKLEAYGVPIVW